MAMPFQATQRERQIVHKGPSYLGLQGTTGLPSNRPIC